MIVGDADLAAALGRQGEDLEREVAAGDPLEERRIARSHRVVDDLFEDSGGPFFLDDLPLHGFVVHPQGEAGNAGIGGKRKDIPTFEHARRVVVKDLFHFGSREAIAHDGLHVMRNEPHARHHVGLPGDARRHSPEPARLGLRDHRWFRGRHPMLRLDGDEGRRSFRRPPFGNLRAFSGEQDHRLTVVGFEGELSFLDRDTGPIRAARADRDVGTDLGVDFAGSAGDIDAQGFTLLRIAEAAHDHAAALELDVARGIEEHGRIFGEVDAGRGVGPEPRPRAARALDERAGRDLVPLAEILAAGTVAIAARNGRPFEPERRVDIQHLDAVAREAARPSTAREGENADEQRCRAAVDRHDIPRSSNLNDCSARKLPI
ncbi:MAG TPA: hypothetical protein VK540_25300 [Polyangiaceae bacterium]|nr:hypothetical protein [Polyangiaceae bacterium]